MDLTKFKENFNKMSYDKEMPIPVRDDISLNSNLITSQNYSVILSLK